MKINADLAKLINVRRTRLSDFLFVNVYTDDTYNIPRVTDCTAALNEWVYSGDLTQLLSVQPRELPELVRRFTQDIYMCVYVQPDIANYGDADEEEDLAPVSLLKS